MLYIKVVKVSGSLGHVRKHAIEVILRLLRANLFREVYVEYLKLLKSPLRSIKLSQ